MLGQLDGFNSMGMSSLSGDLGMAGRAVHSSLGRLTELNCLAQYRNNTFVILSSLSAVTGGRVTCTLRGCSATRKVGGNRSAVGDRMYIVNSFGISVVDCLPELPAVKRSLLTDGFVFSPKKGNYGRTLTTDFTSASICFVAGMNASRFDSCTVGFVGSSGVCGDVVCRAGRARAKATAVLIGRNANSGIVTVCPNTGVAVSSSRVAVRGRTVVGSSIVLLRLRAGCATLRRTVALTRGGDVPIVVGPTPCGSVIGRLVRSISCVAPGRARTNLLSNVSMRSLRSTGQTTRTVRGGKMGGAIVALNDGNSLTFSNGGFVRSPTFPTIIGGATKTKSTFGNSLTSKLTGKGSLRSTLYCTDTFTSLTIRADGTSSVPRRRSIVRQVRDVRCRRAVFARWRKARGRWRRGVAGDTLC